MLIHSNQYKDQIFKLLKKGEDEILEFKSSFSKAVIETVVAFSNKSGGKIILGISDKREVLGLSITEETIQKWINEIKQSTEPSVFPDFQIVEFNGKLLVIAYVDEFPLKPVSYKGRYFTRKMNSNHVLSADEIVELRFVSLNYSFDAFEVLTSFEELDNEALRYFKKRISESGRFKPSDNLVNDFEKLGFIKKGKLTRAAELLFGTHHTSIHLGRFKSHSTIIDDVVIRGPLIIAVEEALDFIKRNIALGYEFGGDGLKRKDRWQYPIPALRELLLNAIVHRDYSNPTDIIVKIYNDNIEISNPGRLIGGLTVEDLKTDNYQAKHRNKLLAEAFYLTGDIEKYGTGFKRLREWIVDYPYITLEVLDLNDFIRIVLSNKEIEPVNDTVNDTVNDRQKQIIKLVETDKKITIEQLSEQTGVSRLTVIRDLKKLRELSIINRVGSDKTGHWEVIK